MRRRTAENERREAGKVEREKVGMGKSLDG